MAKDNGPNLKDTPQPVQGAETPLISPDCRAQRMSGIDAFTECLTKAPGSCRFLFIYGHGRFCTHPLREQIVRQSKG
jgi:hypothetical protein